MARAFRFNIEKEVLGSIGGIIKIHNYRTADDGHSHSNTDIDLSVPCPSTIPMERRNEFFRRSYEELQKVFEGCLIDGMVHKDEVHTYIDPTTKTEEYLWNTCTLSVFLSQKSRIY